MAKRDCPLAHSEVGKLPPMNAIECEQAKGSIFWRWDHKCFEVAAAATLFGEVGGWCFGITDVPLDRSETLATTQRNVGRLIEAVRNRESGASGSRTRR
ncbi:hypothetical protein AMATHDRAFT_8531 [Amanita thiersii Skay4041]|uniref:Uncharacterized protein n=1 Tax=Amanita thiersii Skay4041 TaxID=703135 RepID=A0A2A9NDS1_9AGAR|nr:hypothetical protein AMATHDRAFT_8531 [Amanita thiersii Skay4041]